MFILGVWLASLAVGRLRPQDARRPLLVAELVLLLAALVLAATHGPFPDADHPWGLADGALLVAAMAVQNAFGPLACRDAPSTVVMTTNMTRFFVDLAMLLSPATGGRQAYDAVRQQARLLAQEGGGFLLGCATAALSHMVLHDWALAIPSGCVALAVLLQ